MSKYPNSGILAKNTRATKSTHPTHSGQGEYKGQEFWISAWVKEGKDGKFFSLAFKPKEAQAVSAKREPAPKDSGADFDDDLGL